jgi:hypothetical protein
MSFSIPDNLDNEVSSPLSPSFMGMPVDDWNRCSSPFSAASGSIPTTPSDSFPSSPSPDGFGSYSMEAFEHSFAKSFGDFPAYVNTSGSPFVSRQFSDPNTTDLPASYDLFEQGAPKVHHDLDFSAFIASYSL